MVSCFIKLENFIFNYRRISKPECKYFKAYYVSNNIGFNPEEQMGLTVSFVLRMNKDYSLDDSQLDRFA